MRHYTHPRTTQWQGLESCVARTYVIILDVDMSHVVHIWMRHYTHPRTTQG